MKLTKALIDFMQICRRDTEGPRGGRLKIELPRASEELVVGLCRVVWSGAA
jgi:hypothetical protein